MHVLVVTCAHRGDDARIVHRQARSLIEAGHQVTLISPAPDDPTTDPDGLRRVVVPRAVGRHRVASWRACRRAVRRELPGHTIVLVHDPELVPILARLVQPTPMVWDVHEDFVASVADRQWIPALARPIARRLVGRLERWSRRGCYVILAESSYASGFPDAPVVPNSAWMPDHEPDTTPNEPPTVIYIGRLSSGRGVDELVETGRRLAPRVQLVLVGSADDNVADRIREADRVGHVRWMGHLPNPVALDCVDGAVAALSLLHDEPNYVHSMPTKLIEYLAHGVPIITTPLPLAAALVEASGGGRVVGFDDVDGVVSTIERWLAHPDERSSTARAGHDHVREHHSWNVDGRAFVDHLVRWETGG